MRAGSSGGGSFGCLGTRIAGGGGALRGGGGALYLICSSCGCGCGPGLFWSALSSRWPLASSGCCGSSCARMSDVGDWGPWLRLGSSRRLPSPPNGTKLALFGLACVAAWPSSKAWLGALSSECWPCGGHVPACLQEASAMIAGWEIVPSASLCCRKPVGPRLGRLECGSFLHGAGLVSSCLSGLCSCWGLGVSEARWLLGERHHWSSVS